ncbi:hypothetical protein BJI45_00435 [Limosilactobacillus reuteri]|uniref:Restriction endonuclease n=1 Tax=Limosilactobacillus reuteri TaxID=1598 RepID=A0AB36I3Z7_LIMRT|nr:hypothetical protein [Limosilactobacillus reuteri]OJI11715.1 hypothetical protein BJI45_00435 [Limosilactobacillus reuteri]
MWTDLPEKQKQNYQKLITNFASLSEAFAQKEEDDDSIVAPIINSKFQETAFQRCFNAFAEDIANTSYDASINAGSKKYLVGIKTFGLKSGDQKIAQFKSIAGSPEWAKLIDEMQANARGLHTKAEINDANHKLYVDLAHKIADVRNERIKSSKENLRGFKLDSTPVEAVYHVLMPSSKNETPKISVGETSYSSVDVDNIKIIGCTTVKKPQNFTFTDGIHEYKWSATDSQLSMKFHNTEIVLEKWPVHYVEDAFNFFENLGQQVKPVTTESHSWFLNVQPYSGFNAFMGQPKLARKNHYRENRIAKVMHDYSDIMTAEQRDRVKIKLNKLLLTNWSTDNEKNEMVQLRKSLIKDVLKVNNSKLTQTIEKMTYRPGNELELRIPNALEFHHRYPKFFTGHNVLQPNSNKCIKDKMKRSFKLKFMPSGDKIDAYINQANGKAIESLGKQSTLGKWVLRDVFQLKPYEPLTNQKMIEMGINAVRLTKRNGVIELAFTWIDSDNKPKDFWN